jgi:uncharacterized protein (TIGR03083 family)
MPNPTLHGGPGVVPVDRDAARAALAAAATRTADLVRSIPDPAAPIPRSDWTVGEAAAHLVVVARAFTAAARGRGPELGVEVPDVGDFHERLAQVNAQAIERVPGDDPGWLGDRLADAVREFLHAGAARADAEALDTPWYGRGVTRRLDTLTCLAVGELLLHGRDVAGALGRPWPIEPEHARLVIGGVFPAMIPLVVNPRTAAGVRASYELRIRGGPRMVVRFHDGSASVEPFASQPVDCRVFADPVAFLLVGYGRIGPWAAIARGRMAAGGRRPWLALRYRRLLVDP